MGEAIKKRVQNTLQEIKLDPKRHAAFVTPSPTKVMEKIGFAYPKLNNIMDALDAYVETVLLGQWLLNSGWKAKQFTEEKIAAIARELRSIAEEALYGDRGLLGIIRYSEAWHNHPLPDNMRPLLAGQWHPLIEAQTSPYQINIGTKEHPQMEKIIITARCSHQELKNETSVLKHCVGYGDYGTQCNAGEIHILSLQAGGKPLATLEIELDENNPKELEVVQFEGKKGEKIPEEAKQAWSWFESEFAAGRITLNPTPETGWGETEESKRLNTNPAIIKRIGYIPTPEHVAACHKHYTHGFNVKEESIPSTRRESDLSVTRRYAAVERLIVPAGGRSIEEVRQMIGR